MLQFGQEINEVAERKRGKRITDLFPPVCLRTVRQKDFQCHIPLSFEPDMQFNVTLGLASLTLFPMRRSIYIEKMSLKQCRFTDSEGAFHG